jgi:hypothetical protein
MKKGESRRPREDTELRGSSLSLRWSPVGSFANPMLVVCYSLCMASAGLTFSVTSFGLFAQSDSKVDWTFCDFLAS